MYSEQVAAYTKTEYRSWEKNTGSNWNEIHSISQSDSVVLLEHAKAERANRLKEIVNSVIGSEVLLKNVCDIGGMTGNLMGRISAQNKYVFDTNLTLVSDGISRLQKIEQYRECGPFDLLIFSHVLEHIPKPIVFLADFLANVSPTGLVYIEVPVEYCGAVLKRRGIPLTGHINYFTKHSLLTMLGRCGFGKIEFYGREQMWYGEQRMLVFRVLARQGQRELSHVSALWRKIALISDSIETFRMRRSQSANLAKLKTRPSV
jgi:Methyltransferase domain